MYEIVEPSDDDRGLTVPYLADLSIEEAAAVVVVHSYFDRRNHGPLPKGEPVLLELETDE